MEQGVAECELVPFSDGTPLGDVLRNNCFLKDFKLLKMPPRNVKRARDIFLEKLKSPRKKESLEPTEAASTSVFQNAAGMGKGWVGRLRRRGRNIVGPGNKSNNAEEETTTIEIPPPWIAWPP